MTVTAAHELLHAEYEKLGAGRRGKINILLAETFKHLADQDIRQRIGLYPEAQRLSEAHSILGTEVGNLPKDLETYYATYFLHRRGISQISERLKLESKKRAAEIDKYDSQLNKLKLKFENLRDEISKQERTIQDEKDDLDRLKDVGRIDEYNRLARSSNKRIADYNSEVHRAEKILNQFKELLAKRNSIAVETQEMAKALDSRVLSNSHKLEKTH
jgi:chromosome segregation ATPase